VKSGLTLGIFLLILVLCSGCVVLGKNTEFQPLDPTLLAALVPGQSTAADVCKVLGAPSQVVELSNGNAYVYRRSVTKGTGVWLVLVSFVNAEEQHDQVVFLFDKSDLLTHYGVSLNAGKAAYGFPF
jgi:outer membrane protein assembly factor BamE (lipoprotein component of BamABCDE complex)